MQLKHSILLLAAVTATLAFELAVRVHQPDLSPRDPIATGGWALALPDGSAPCPADAPGCGSDWCCPSSLTCVKTGGAAEAEVCCDNAYINDEGQCIQDFGHLHNTTCADSSWVLWNTTTAGYPIGFFCCLPGQLGTQDGWCLNSSALASASASPAVLIGATATSSSTKRASTPTSTVPGSASGSGSSAASSTAIQTSKGVGLGMYGALTFAQVLAAGFAVALL